MIYILEGADGAGKSSVFQWLKEHLEDAVFIKESYTPSLEERKQRVNKFERLLQSGKTVVYDRATILDDYIYEPIMANAESQLDGSVTWPLLKQATVIYFDCPVKVLAERLARRGDDYVEEYHLQSIVDAYEEVFASLIRPYRVDATCSLNALCIRIGKIVKKKEFKIAHIVPVGSLAATSSNGYHMCLANVAVKNEKYKEFYRQMAKDRFVLMDNGAAEGDQLHVDDLIKCYQDVQPSEVVLPDTLCNGVDTIQKSKLALKEICDFYDGAVPFTFMAVPQGSTFDQWLACAEEMVQWPEIHTIGVSKFLQMELNAEYARYAACIELDRLFKKYNRGDMEVHLLGCSESPHVIEDIRKSFSFVRGCDSAYAYICTQANVPIFHTTERPEGEIDFINGATYKGLNDNMQALELAVGVYDNKMTKIWSE